MGDRLLKGLGQIAELLEWSEKTVSKRLKELCGAGIVFTMMRGRPPRKIYCAWESSIKIWTVRKGMKGETL